VRSVRLVAYALLAVMVLTLASGAVLWHQGYRVYAVRTGSMSPTYPTGALVIDGPAPTRLPPAGKVITFRTQGGLVTHRVVAHTIGRVVAHTTGGATTKGDANRTPDAWTVPLTGMVGEVRTSIDRAGYALVFLQQPTGAPALAVLGISMVLAWSLFFPSGATRTPGQQD
jgi:signal peptidase I